MRSWEKRGLQHPTEPWVRKMLNEQLDEKADMAMMQTLVATLMAVNEGNLTVAHFEERCKTEKLSEDLVAVVRKAADLIKAGKAATTEEAIALALNPE